ncbi:MAG: VWA domain-containing protein [Bdellovibrionales bacterium]|jgi:Ca-activated chloride channel family protein|nr:VWA domain-containing protein [Bdellovibrionales bacterium]
MDDRKLEELLSRLTAPEPSKDAENQALDRAMAAFDQKMSQTAQGKSATQRLTGISNILNHVRSKIMKKRYIVSGTVGAVATCALVAVLGAPFFHQQVTGLLGTTAQGDVSSLQLQNASALFEGSAEAVKASSATVDMDMREESERQAASAPMPIDGVTMEAMPQVAEPFHAGRAAPRDRAAAPLKEEAKKHLEMAPMQKSIAATADRAMPATAPSVQRHVTGGAELMIAPMPSADDVIVHHYQEQGRDQFQSFEENSIKNVKAEPVSTFSIDVDTSSYSFVRRALNSGVLPQKNAIRIEEMINYFDYDYAVPEQGGHPFQPTVAVYDSPWRSGNKLVHIGIKGYEVQQKPQSNLVFLIDTSGSMYSPDKLPLLISSFKMLLDTLSPDDTIGIVTYAGSSGVALEPTKASDKQKILSVLEGLRASGGTSGGEGIRLAYQLAEQSFVKGGNNRIILATDGDFNIGITNRDELKGFVERKRKAGIFLSVLGFGQGNYNDHMMQTLAQNGNGTAAYIDNLSEARKVLVDEGSSMLFTIAKDVKLQVEFNPQTVQEYRLVGYETRALNREDFNNDKVDAGDIGAGHTVTAIYEITPVGVAPVVDDLRYQKPAAKVMPDHPVVAPVQSDTADAANGDEYAFLKIRYKKPDSDTSVLMTRPITKADEKAFDALDDDIRFANAVAGFAQMLKGSKFVEADYDAIIETANQARGKDEFGYRTEFVSLVRLAKTAAGLQQQR